MPSDDESERATRQVRDALLYPDLNDVDCPNGDSDRIRIRPTAENTILNNAELAALRTAGFAVTTIDMDNEEVWVRDSR
jgi:hypothetical protein